MRVWLIGADEGGIKALRQLQKGRDVEVFVSARSERPRAVAENVIDRVNYVEHVTSVNINSLARRIRPDLILIDAGADERNYGRMTGGLVFSDALTNEVATVSEYPCLIV
jgi:hypothetical protein